MILLYWTYAFFVIPSPFTLKYEISEGVNLFWLSPNPKAYVSPYPNENALWVLVRTILWIAPQSIFSNYSFCSSNVDESSFIYFADKHLINVGSFLWV